MNRYEIQKNQNYKKIGNRLIRTDPALQLLREVRPKIIYLESQQVKTRDRGAKLIYAECKKVEDFYQFCCRYDIAIVVYTPNVADFSDKQLEKLLLHELLHIGVDVNAADSAFFVKSHDVEEFQAIIDRWGADWSVFGSGD